LYGLALIGFTPVYAMLLWRQTTPLVAVSASLRSVAVATPPTPPVLQTAEVGGSGPGWSGHWPLPVHCAFVIEQRPIAGHSARSTPGTVQAALVIEQLPGTLAQGTCELHAAWVLAQVPIDEQSDELRHVTLASFAQVPRTSGQVPGLALQAAFGGLLQVPWVRHCRSAAAWVAPLHTLPVFAPAFLQVPGVVGHCAAEPQAFCVHALPPQSAVVVHAVVPFGQVFCAQVPPAVAGQLAPLVHAFAVHDPTTPPQAASFAQTVVALGQVFWLHAPLIVVHCATEVHA